MTTLSPPTNRRWTAQDDRQNREHTGESSSNLSESAIAGQPRASGDPTAPATVPAGPRDLRLDLFRGLALIFIFIDHIPENVLSYLTLQAVQFFDAAEVFIFVSGYTAALVYGRTLALYGAFYSTAQILRRVWQLYVAHIFLFMIFIAEVSYTVTTFNNPMYNDEMRVADFLGEPHIAIVKALLLEFQPTFLDILPLYILLLVIFPVILLGLRRQPLLVLIPSFLVYAVVQITGVSVPAYPEGHVWYFNPLAWQFLFTAGAALGLGLPPFRRRLRPAGALLAVAIAIAALGLAIKLSWTIHGMWDLFPGVFLKELWPVNKSNLSPIRLVPFFSVVVVVAAFVRPDAVLPAFAGGEALYPLRPTVVGDFLSRNSPLGTRSFSVVGV